MILNILQGLPPPADNSDVLLTANALEQRQDSRTSLSRYTELDALRGLAACTVVLHHLALAYSIQAPWYLWPFVAGHEAVILFFTLSGFVLSLPFWNKGTNGPYVYYLLRRFFRIYVPFAGAIALACIGAATFPHSRLPLGEWFYRTWQTGVTPTLIGRQLMLWPGAELNTAFWSLRYEVQMSMVFPLLLVLLRPLRSWCAISMAFVLIYAGWKLRLHPSHDPHFYMETLEYGAMFIAGAVLARCRQQLLHAWSTVPSRIRFLIPFTSGLLYFGYAYGTEHHPVFYHAKDLLTTIGACGLIMSCMYSSVLRRTLQYALPQYLGRVSFSMYLVHGTILFALLNLLYWRVPLLAFTAIFLFSTLLASHLFCVFLEEPSMRLGKRLATGSRITMATAQPLTSLPSEN